jgi:hypothetical protein
MRVGVFSVPKTSPMAITVRLHLLAAACGEDNARKLKCGQTTKHL